MNTFLHYTNTSDPLYLNTQQAAFPTSYGSTNGSLTRAQSDGFGAAKTPWLVCLSLKQKEIASLALF